MSAYPAISLFEPNYIITGEVTDFTGQPGGELTLALRWLIIDGSTDETLSARHSLVTINVAANDYASLINAHNQALQQVSIQISQEIRRLESEKNNYIK